MVSRKSNSAGKPDGLCCTKRPPISKRLPKAASFQLTSPIPATSYRLSACNSLPNGWPRPPRIPAGFTEGKLPFPSPLVSGAVGFPGRQDEILRGHAVAPIPHASTALHACALTRQHITAPPRCTRNKSSYIIYSRVSSPCCFRYPPQQREDNADPLSPMLYPLPSFLHPCRRRELACGLRLALASPVSIARRVFLPYAAMCRLGRETCQPCTLCTALYRLPKQPCANRPQRSIHAVRRSTTILLAYPASAWSALGTTTASTAAPTIPLFPSSDHTICLPVTLY